VDLKIKMRGIPCFLAFGMSPRGNVTLMGQDRFTTIVMMSLLTAIIPHHLPELSIDRDRKNHFF